MLYKVGHEETVDYRSTNYCSGMSDMRSRGAEAPNVVPIDFLMVIFIINPKIAKGHGREVPLQSLVILYY